VLFKAPGRQPSLLMAQSRQSPAEEPSHPRWPPQQSLTLLVLLHAGGRRHGLRKFTQCPVNLHRTTYQHRWHQYIVTSAMLTSTPLLNLRQASHVDSSVCVLGQEQPPTLMVTQQQPNKPPQSSSTHPTAVIVHPPTSTLPPLPHAQPASATHR
jgi:hypothetical protein